MADEKSRFQTNGLSWKERAPLGELRAVLSPAGSNRENLFIHHVHQWYAKRIAKTIGPDSVVLDFGCGTGRFLRFFAQRAAKVYGTEITPEMLNTCRDIGVPANAELMLTDGIHIDLPADSVDLVWCCAVLRYSLFVADPCYDEIARELYRVLRPGGRIACLEMYTERPITDLLKGFEATGFRTEAIHALQRYPARLERYAKAYVPEPVLGAVASTCCAMRWATEDPRAAGRGLRDYACLWRKPEPATRDHV